MCECVHLLQLGPRHSDLQRALGLFPDRVRTLVSERVQPGGLRFEALGAEEEEESLAAG